MCRMAIDRNRPPENESANDRRLPRCRHGRLAIKRPKITTSRKNVAMQANFSIVASSI